MEEEFEEFRKAAEAEAEERLKEVLHLRAELNSLERSTPNCHTGSYIIVNYFVLKVNPM